jgi:prepilin-type N-terminal cleavage/methylation domain-containing protein
MRSDVTSARHRDPRRSGFTLVEVLTSVSIGTIVLGALMTVFLWCSRQVDYASRVSWSHMEALESSRTILCYLRGAKQITAVDTNEWRWVEVLQSNGTVGRLVYENPVQHQRDGYMYLTNSAGKRTIIARGMTEIMSDSFSVPIFRQTGPNALRVSYRVVEPIAQRPGEIRDHSLGAIVDTGVCLRNAPR